MNTQAAERDRFPHPQEPALKQASSSAKYCAKQCVSVKRHVMRRVKAATRLDVDELGFIALVRLDTCRSHAHEGTGRAGANCRTGVGTKTMPTCRTR